jgi:hypothetical protein
MFPHLADDFRQFERHGAAIGITEHDTVNLAAAAACRVFMAYCGFALYPSKKCSAS